MIRFISGVFALVAFIPSVASADVDVSPDSWSPKLHLRAEEPTESGPVNAPPPDQTAPAQPGTPSIPRNAICVEDSEGVQQCYLREFDPEDPEPEEGGRELTPGDVLRATREIGLPSLQVQIQPGGKTLVNVPTIFYAQPQPFARSVSLLGFAVDVAAEPVSYQWIHGDGTTATTTTPGTPYPGKDVTHRYRTPADDVQARVDVTYRVRYRVDGGPWQTIGQTLLASGLAAELDVKEAAPVMTTPRV